MKKPTRWVGLDVHAETIAVAVAEEDGTVRSVGTIPNDRAPVERMMQQAGETRQRSGSATRRGRAGTSCTGS